MSGSSVVPLLEGGANDLSVIAGASEEFDLGSLLRSAKAVRIAMAFGHDSGWKEIEEHLTHSSATTVQILLGQAFFLTEPLVVLKIKSLQQTSKAPKFKVKLASVRATFHPKVWIIDRDDEPVCIVGSGNLSSGGLLRNVECGLLTSSARDVNALTAWFDACWNASPPLAKTLDDYVAKYQRISAARKTIDAHIEAATREQADKEATWRRKTAINMASDYWRSREGRADVRAREHAIEKMRGLLHYPAWEFGADEWSQFLRIPELGRIRLGHEQLTISGLPQVRGTLKKLTTKSMNGAKLVEDLQSVPGIGRNLATKLLAVYRPEQFVVVNGPVESALRAFGYEIEISSRISGKGYETFLKELEEFIQESESLDLSPAPALDAFFYAYQNFAADQSPA
jgi:HKD family nuclease